MFQSIAWETAQGDPGNVVFTMTGNLSKVVGYPSFSCVTGQDRIAVFQVNNGQYHKLVVQTKVKINAGCDDEFEWPVVAEYMLYDRPHGERSSLRAFLEELRQNEAGKYFQLNFKFSIVIERMDERGNAVPKQSTNGKSAGRILAQVLGFEIIPFQKKGTVINPSLLKPTTNKPIINGSID